MSSESENFDLTLEDNENTGDDSGTQLEVSSTSTASNIVDGVGNYHDVSQIPYDEAIGMVENFNTFISAFRDIPKLSTNPEFMKLKEAGLEAGYSEKFDGDVEDIISSAQSLSSALQAQIEECRVADLETEKSIPDSPSRGSSNSTSTNLVDNADKQLDAYENMSMSDLKEVLSTLVSAANACGTDLTSLISDSKYADNIKEALLSNVNLNKDLKLLYQKADSKVIQKLLNSIVNGSENSIVGLNTETILTVKKYLSMIADDNGINLDELISNEGYSEKIKSALRDFGTVFDYVSQLKQDSIQESFGDIYDGNNVGDKSVGIINSIRSYISAVSDKNNIPSEELLFDKNNNDLLISGVDNLCKSPLYADTISYCNSSNILEILNTLLKK